MKRKDIEKNTIAIRIMHAQIMAIGNEYAEEIWFYVYPDGADYDDIVEMAKDLEYMEILYKTYEKIVNRYAPHAFFLRPFEIKAMC